MHLRSDRRKKKVVLVGPIPPPVNGQSQAFETLLRWFHKSGVSYSVVNLSRGAQTVDTTNTFSWRRLLEYVSILFDYIKKVSFGRKVIYITVAQTYQGFLRDMFMILYASVFRHEIICHLHGGNYHNFYNNGGSFLKKAIQFTLERADSIIILSERLKNMFFFSDKIKARLVCIPNGFSVESKYLSNKPKAIGARINILYLSNLVESKGYLDVLEAINILVNSYKIRNITCHFCGKFYLNSDDITVKSIEEAQNKFFKFIQDNRLADNVNYHGITNGDKKYGILSISHFFILPTNYNNEGQPLSIIEAMACKNVVITTAYRAIPDLVIDGVTGCFVQYHSPHEIAAKIMYLIENPNQFIKMSEAAFQHYQAYFTREKHLHKLTSHICKNVL